MGDVAWGLSMSHSCMQQAVVLKIWWLMKRVYFQIRGVVASEARQKPEVLARFFTWTSGAADQQRGTGIWGVY